jgi:hypothetical protein
LDVLLADKAGYLMPSEENLSITTKLASATKVSVKDCAKVNRKNLQISLCANEADFIGGFSVSAIIQTGTEGEFSTISTSILATLKNGKGLTEISAERSVLSTFYEKLFTACINSPHTLEADSAFLDDSVKEGMNKGVLTPDEPVVISVGNCLLNK